MARKHTSVGEKLLLIRSWELKNLDKTMYCPAQQKVCAGREIIMGITIPIVGAPKNNTRHLFNSVDLAKSGDTAGREHFLTCPEDRIDVGEAVSDIWPEFFDHYTGCTGREASRLWCKEESPLESTIQWEYDDNDEWTGNWRTEDDVGMAHIVNENVGIDVKVEIDGMDKLQDKTRRVMATGDALSCKSFDMNSVKERQAQSSQSKPADQEEGSVASAASGAPGGSGLNA